MQRQGAVCVVCNKKIDPKVDRPISDRRKWFCSNVCWQRYVKRIFQQTK